MFNKTINDYQGLEEPFAEMADDRVNAIPSLKEYRDILIDYDWDNQEDHWEWVATGDVGDILDWARTIREQEND
jgi:hypothetical protein